MAKKSKDEAKKKDEIVLVQGENIQESIIQTFEKNFGEGMITTLDRDVTSSVREWISSGSYLIDEIVSGGRGLPVGKVVTLTGKKSSGKSTIVAHLIAEAQKMGAITVLFDAEIAFDKDRAQSIGVDVSQLLISQPDYVEQVFDQIKALIDIAASNDKLLVVIWDSISATPTQSELGSNTLVEGGAFGEHSKLLSKGFRKFAKDLATYRVLLFIIDQVKSNLASSWGDGKTYIAKNPLDFHSHVMLDIWQIGTVKEGDVEVGIESTVKVAKNRVGPPLKHTTVRVMFANGLNKNWEILEIGKRYTRVLKDGSWLQVVKPCTCSSGKDANGKKCSLCDGSNYQPYPGIKKFYGNDIGEMFEKYKGLKEYLMHGVPIPVEGEKVKTK